MTVSRGELAPLIPAGEVCTGVEPLAGDGSSRRYYRVRTDRTTYVLCANPDAAENAAVERLSRHLSRRGVRVPRVVAGDPARGWLLQEDLGDRNLLADRRACTTDDQFLALYRPVLEVLCTLQVDGRRGYDPAWGHFPDPYDAPLMVQEEGLYFAREFAEGLCGLAVPEGFRRDVERLAAEGARAPRDYLLHRDFQSRNIHLTPSGPAVIDFQGCRFGPLAYDVAALVLDPYAELPRAARARLLDHYRTLLRRRGVAPEAFDAGWFAVGSFRLLQALGAFAKLGGRFGKPGFLEHAAAGLDHLVEHLGDRGPAEFPNLHETVLRSRRAWRRRDPVAG